jgi:hypothetical protein
LGLQQSAKTGQQGGRAYEPIGPVHREIAEKSPVAIAVIEQTAPNPGVLGYRVAIRAAVRNITDHELQYVNPELVYDVTDSRTGKRVAETPAGCYWLFFSECYTPSEPPGRASEDPAKYVIPPYATIEILPMQYLDMDYKLDPGDYAVVGYFCASKREGPECFKSNKIRISISETNGTGK